MRIPGRALLVALAAGLLAGPVVAQTTAAPAPAPAPAPTAPPAAAPAEPPAGAAPPAAGTPAATGEAKPDAKPSTPAGGYSWTDKPRRQRRAAKAKNAPRMKIDPKGPLATYPGFRMLQGGKSTVWVYVSRKVKVDVRRAAGRVTYVMSGAQIGIWNNTHPLVTHFFDTPLSRAWLRPDKTGAELVLELRENVQPTHRIVDGPGGTMILQVELPRAAKRYANARSAAPRRSSSSSGASAPRP